MCIICDKFFTLVPLEKRDTNNSGKNIIMQVLAENPEGLTTEELTKLVNEKGQAMSMFSKTLSDSPSDN